MLIQTLKKINFLDPENGHTYSMTKTACKINMIHPQILFFTKFFEYHFPFQMEAREAVEL